MKAMNTRSSLSKRLKMRRKPLSLRNSRSISLRRRYSAFLILQGSTPLWMGRHDGYEAQIERELASLVAFICAVHQQVAGEGEFWSSLDRVQQRTTLGGIAGLPG